MPQRVIGDVLKKGEEMFQTVSGKLLERPGVAKAFEAAMVGKSKMDEGMALAFKQMNVQSRSEFRGLKARVESLESQIGELREALNALKASSARPAAGRTAAKARPRARKGPRKA